MVEKIKISLWDISTFFLSGFLLFFIVTAFFLAKGALSFITLKEVVFAMPVGVSFFLLPVLFAVLGMLLEPIANAFDKFIINPIFKKLAKNQLKNQDKTVEEFIKSQCLGALNGKMAHPFALCKEYVETKQLSSTFMVFLSRYGFYRNASFLAFLSIVLSIWVYSFTLKGLILAFIAFMLAVLFKMRAEDFYSYQAPSVYYAFLIDKLDWKLEVE